MQFGPREPCRIREVAVGIQRAIAQEPKSVAVKTVGARLGDGVHDRAAEFSVFGVEAVGDQSKFLDRVQVGNQAGAQVASFTHVPAVHKERVRRFALAVNGDVARGQ